MKIDAHEVPRVTKESALENNILLISYLIDSFVQKIRINFILLSNSLPSNSLILLPATNI